MKSEKVLGLLACALACTISGSAFANTTNSWFGVKPTGTDIGLASVTTNGVAVTVQLKRPSPRHLKNGMFHDTINEQNEREKL